MPASQQKKTLEKTLNQQLQRCAKKDTNAFNLIVKQLAKHLHAYAYCVVSKAQAAQITEDCFYLIWHHAQSYNPNTDAVGWVMSIFRHRLAQQVNITATQNKTHFVTIAQLKKAKQQLPLHHTVPFMNAFNHLDETQRQIILLRYLFALNDQECAQSIDLSGTQIHIKLNQAVISLVKALAPWQVQDNNWQRLNAKACIDALFNTTAQQTLQNKLNANPQAILDTLRWESLFANLCFQLPPVTVPTQWFHALGERVGFDVLPHRLSQEDAQEVKFHQNIALRWKLFSIVNLLIIIGLVIFIFLPKPAPIQVIKMAPRLGSILQAPGHSATPGWILTVDPQGQVLLIPKVKTELTNEQKVQLWTRTQHEAQPRSLGLINPNEPVTISREKIGPVQEGQLFEMTLENIENINNENPQGPILFIGRVVALGKYENQLEGP